MEGGKLSKRIGSLSLKDLKDDGLESTAVVSLMARLGSSDPIEPFTDVQDVIKEFDLGKFSRGTPKFDDRELYRLNAKILQKLSFADVKGRLADMDLAEMDEEFWNAIKLNMERITDAKEWWQVANGPVKPIIEDADFAKQAMELLPPTPWSDNTWAEWTSAVKEKTGRKGKQLFMPIRQALTGMDHGPEMKQLLLLIGEEKVKERLST